MPTKIQSVIFDFGGVLIDWNPRYLYSKIFHGDAEKVESFLQTVEFAKWNERSDRGERSEDLVREAGAKFPKFAAEIRAFYERFPETLGPVLEDTVRLLERLYIGGVALYGLTNWSSETFHPVKVNYPFFRWFRGIVVSGDEKVAKPERKIFEVTLERYKLSATETLFIDDKEANILAARALGLKAHWFQGAAQLETELRELELLP